MRRRGRWVGAVASGGLLAAAFPPADHGWLAWAALIPLLVVVPGARPGRAFGLGWLAGTLGYGLVTHWLVWTLTHFTSLSLPAALGVHGLVAGVLGCYPGLFAWVVSVTARRGLPWVWVAPAAWVATEWLRGWLVVGFPWALLGVSQQTCLPVAQLAAVTGVPGVSALLVLASAVLAAWIRGERPRGSTVAVVLVVAGVIEWGRTRMATLEAAPPAGHLRVGIVQSHVTQARKWQPEHRRVIVNRFHADTVAVAAAVPDVIVWPETATPFAFEDHPRGRAALERLVTQAGVPLVFGSPATERPRPDERRRYNRAYLLGPSGEVATTYDKQVLVPFGEYMPAGRLLPFLRPIVGGPGSLSPGRPAAPMRVGATPVGVLICYEAMVPGIARAHVRAGARVLLNLSNDAWYTGTAASAQLVAEARLRAIEAGVPVVRVANAGISAVVTPTGRLAWRAPSTGSGWHAAAVWWPAGRTGYTRWGDVVVWLAVGATALAVTKALLYRPARALPRDRGMAPSPALMRSPTRSGGRVWRETLLLDLAAVAIVTWLLGGLLRSWDRVCPDDWDYFHGLAEISRRTIVEFGQLPLWTPYLCGGTEHLGNAETEFLSPLFPLVLAFGSVAGLKLFAWAHFVIGFAGSLRLARLLGLRGAWPLLPAVTFTACGFHVWHLRIGHLPFLQFQWLPWIVWGYLGARHAPRQALLGAAALGIATLSGGTYAVPFACLLVGSHAAVTALATTPRWRPLAAAATVIGGGVLLGAAKALPAWSFVGRVRGALTIDGAVTPPALLAPIFLDPTPWASLSAMRYGVWEYANYVGPGAVVFALLGLVAVRDTWPWLVVGLGCLLLAIGGFSPWAPFVLLHQLPVFESLRAPSRYLVLVVMAFGMAATQGLARLLAWLDARPTGARRAGRGVLATFGIWVTVPVLWHNAALLPAGHCDFGPRATEAASFHLVGFGPTWATVRRGLGLLPCERPNVAIPRSIFLWTGEREQVDVVPPEAGRAHLARFTPERWTVRAELAAPAVVRLNQNHRTSFVASHGTVVETGGLVGVRLGAGVHEFSVRFHPDPTVIGGACLGLLAWTALAALLGRRPGSRVGGAGGR